MKDDGALRQVPREQTHKAHVDAMQCVLGPKFLRPVNWWRSVSEKKEDIIL